MENSHQLAEPLALAVSECLRKQEVVVNEVVLTSYLLEVSPDPEILNRLELENQIDSLGNVGNVSITLARMEDDGCVAREEGVEQLVVIGGKDKKKKGFLVHNVQAYMQKAGDTCDISPQFFLDFPQNFRLRTRNQYCTQAIA